MVAEEPGESAEWVERARGTFSPHPRPWLRKTYRAHIGLRCRGAGHIRHPLPGCVRGEDGLKHPDLVWSFDIPEEEWDLLGRRG